MAGSSITPAMLKYLEAVTYAFEDEPEKIHEFAKILADFSGDGLEASNAISRMEKLFKDHQTFLRGFVFHYLPPYASINFPPEARKTRAFSYMISVKQAFEAEPQTYYEFKCLLSDYKAGRSDVDIFIANVELLMKYHQNLLQGFVDNFLPPYAKIHFPPEARKTRAFSYMNSVKEAFRAQPANYDQFERLLGDYSARKSDADTLIANVEELMKDHQNLLLGFIFFLPKDRRNLSSEAEQRVEKFLGKLKGSDCNMFESFCEILDKFEEGEKPLEEVHKEVVELLQGREDLVMELSEFLSGRPLEIAKYIERLLEL